MAEHSQRDEKLLEAIETEIHVRPADDTDIEHTKDVATYEKINALFAGLRQPGDIPEKVGRYEIRKMLGSGSFGAVYLAHDPELEREVAIKIPHADRFVSEEDEANFVKEARSTATLSDPAIVTVFDVGREGGHCYLVLDYIPGASLEHALQGGTYAPDDAAKLIAKVAKGLHYAHKKGFVHRDLKPGNILLDEEGEPRITDFGLAVTEESQRQLAGQVAGTPAYMSPEQVRGDVHHLDGRSDIWALGVMLYEMVTGRHPFWRGDVQECIDEIQHREPKPPRQIDDAIPAELERIILKCLSKDVTARYTTADDLKQDLNRFRVGSSEAITDILAESATSDLAPILANKLTDAIGDLDLAILGNEDWARDESSPRKVSANVKSVGLTLSISVTAMLLIAIGAILFWKSSKGNKDYPSSQLLETAYNQKFSGVMPQLQIIPAFTRDDGKAWQTLTDGSALASKDAYRLNIRLDHDCFVYVWQVDSQGKIFWLYPQNPTCDFSSGSNHSLASRGVQLPPGSSDGFELDDTVGIEHLYVAASPTRWENLEKQLQQMANKMVTKGKVTEPFAMKTRGVKGIRRLPTGDNDAESSDNDTSLWIEGQDGAVVQEIWFRHVQDSQ